MLEQHIYLEHREIQEDDGKSFDILAPVSAGNLIPSRAKWVTFVEAVEEFYSTVTHQEIRRTNEEMEKRWRHLFREQDKAVAAEDGAHEFVYVLECNGLHKIGRTKNVERRYKQICNDIPFPVMLCGWRRSSNSYALEKALHGVFANRRFKGEWFQLGDAELKILKSLLSAPEVSS